MSAFKVSAILGVAVVISTAAYSAHFVGQQIEYLQQKLSPSTRDQNSANEGPLKEAALPSLQEQLSNTLQTTSPLSLTVFSFEKAANQSSR
ncbi:hypothetical protein [Pseudomonas fluorescens]|uniref:hypothetical protein n=1 Tax=Pseudomonas fluorescens TaxID=294 RepID=UPI000F81E5E6|nr:hypothetical protein [Pseudomonas fluorescens]